MKKIVQKDNDTLHQKAEEVQISDIPSPKIQQLLDEMRETLAAEDDGIALAAPQIDVSLRVFILSPPAYETITGKSILHSVFINPIITKQSKDKKLMDEGCLSVRPWYGKVRRSTRITIEAYDERGENFSLKAKGILAQIIQHEVDHLDGILFVDKAKDLIELPTQDHE